MSNGISLNLFNLTSLNGGDNSTTRTLSVSSTNSGTWLGVPSFPNPKSLADLSSNPEGQSVDKLSLSPGISTGKSLDLSLSLLDTVNHLNDKKNSGSSIQDPTNTREIVKIVRTDQPYLPTQLIDYSSQPIQSVEDLFRALPEDLYSILRSRKAENSSLKLLQNTPLNQLPNSDLSQLKVVFDKPIELNPSQTTIIEHIPNSAPLPEKISIFDLARLVH